MCNSENKNTANLPLLEPTSKTTIFNLTTDCCDEIFDYLTTKDLHSIGSTCKAMQKVAGEFFKRNWTRTEQFTYADGINIGYFDQDNVYNRTDLSAFTRYVTNISHYHDFNTAPLRFIKAHNTELESMKGLYLVCNLINEEKVDYFRKILPKIKLLTIQQCTARGNFYDVFLKFCEIVKHFRLIECMISSSGNPWMINKFPKLEHFHLILREEMEIHELAHFFQQNPNVQSFKVTINFLHMNRNLLMNSEAKLSRLFVEDFKYDSKEKTKESIELLKQLHEKGFYKRLHLTFEKINQEMCDQIALLPALEKVRFKESSNNGIYSLQSLINLKMLSLPRGIKASDIEVLAINLVNLEKITASITTSDDILPFMRHSKNLKKAKVYLDSGILSLAKLNKEREKLADARKVFIYVRDNTFLATKWKGHYGETNFNLVEMRRLNSLRKVL